MVVGDLGINMIPLNTTWEQQHQHVCTLCWIVQAHIKKKKKERNTQPKVNASISTNSNHVDNIHVS